MVLNFSLSVGFRLEMDDPAVITITAISDMFHAKKANLSLVNGIFEMIQKITDYRTHKIKYDTNSELDMHNSCSYESYTVIGLQKRPSGEPALISFINGIDQTCQYEPAGKRMKG